MDNLPMFEDPPVTQEQPPKKPRKPTRRKAARKVAAPPPKAVPKRRKRRVAKTVKVVARRRGRPPGALNKATAAITNGMKAAHHGGRYSKAVYTVIGTLMGMESADRDVVLDIVKGLSA